LESAGGAAGWKASSDGKSFRTDGTAPGETWLCYRHIVPGYDDWASLMGILPPRPGPPEAQLISDFVAYDTDQRWYAGPPGDRRAVHAFPPPLPGGLGQPPSPSALGLNWVGDLVVEFDLTLARGKGQILVDLVKGGHRFLCQLDSGDGTAELAILGGRGIRPKSAAGILGSGKHQVRLANVDQQLVLWIDGRVVKFDPPATYDAPDIDTVLPNQEDLLPVRIGSRGAAAEVSHLRIFRDIYYVAVESRSEQEFSEMMTDFRPSDPDYPYTGASPSGVVRFFSDPSRWGIFQRRRSVEFTLEKDQFFMLGDNSPESKDGRLWDGSQFYVNRDLLIGEALLIYWPHSWNRIPGTRIPFPFFPNFSRMGCIR
jgi:signal peptidase I